MQFSHILKQRWFQAAVGIVVVAGGVAAIGLGWRGVSGAPAGHAATDTVPVAQLMAPQPLPDIVLGAKDAPVTIVEYASMTCPHCGRFHAETYPTLKSKYIDTGKVRFILREFPLDSIATAAFMLARCSGSDEARTGLVDLLFDHQDQWAFVDDPKDGLLNLVRQAGFSKATFDSCLANKDLHDKVEQERAVAAEKFGVEATPTFFVNGKRVDGEISVEALSQLLDPLIKKS